MDDVELEITDDAISAIARKAITRKTGARGLRAIMEKTMMDAMYEIPSDGTITECIIRKDNVGGLVEPEMLHDESAGTARITKQSRKRSRGETA